MKDMKMSQDGLTFLMNEEVLRLKAYKDQIGVWTIGVGHTGPDVYEGRTITKEEAMAILADDLARFERAVRGHVTYPLTQPQFDALVSFTFNVGTNGFITSTMLKLLNKGEYKMAADEFLKWVKGGGRTLPVLVGRRQRERALFLSGTKI